MFVLAVVCKVIIWVLIFLLSVVALLLLLLCVPFRYSAAKPAGAHAPLTVRVSWFLRLFRYSYTYADGRGSGVLSVAFFTYSMGKEKKPLTQKTKTKPSKKTKNKGKPKPKPKPKTEKSSGEKKSLKEQLLQIKSFLTYPDRKIIIALTIKLLKRICWILKPSYTNIEVLVGFDDPSVTGWVICGYEAADGIFGLRRLIRIQGDFTKKAFYFFGQVRGKINLMRLTVPIVKYCLRKPIFKLLRGLRKDRKEN